MLLLPIDFQHSPFFSEQLTAFQVWLAMGAEERDPPEQLPIVLQVLLSQVHRLRALDLLGRFLDLGPWAVNLVSPKKVLKFSQQLYMMFMTEKTKIMFLKLFPVLDLFSRVMSLNTFHG